MKNLSAVFMCITLSVMVMLASCALVSEYSHRNDAALACETDMECEMATGVSY